MTEKSETQVDRFVRVIGYAGLGVQMLILALLSVIAADVGVLTSSAAQYMLWFTQIIFVLCLIGALWHNPLVRGGLKEFRNVR